MVVAAGMHPPAMAPAAGRQLLLQPNPWQRARQACLVMALIAVGMLAAVSRGFSAFHHTAAAGTQPQELQVFERRLEAESASEDSVRSNGGDESSSRRSGQKSSADKKDESSEHVQIQDSTDHLAEDGHKVVVNDRAWRHDDQKKMKADVRSGEMAADGKRVVAIGDEDHKILCEHYPETKLQLRLLLKVLRCECSWEFEDYFGITLAVFVALVCMAFARQCGNSRRNSVYKQSTWLCSCTTVFAVINGIVAGFARTACFTWADVCFMFAIMGCCCIPCCFCTAWSFADPPPMHSDGTPVKEEDLPPDDEEGGLLCCLSNNHLGEVVSPKGSRDMGRGY